MKKLRILVLVHETLVPPETLEGVAEQDAAEFRTEFDVTSSLRAMGHDVRPIGIGDSLTELRATIQDEYCDQLTADGPPDPVLTAQRLSGTQMLVSTRCWLGAYNVGEGYWIVSHRPPFNPVLVSASISESGAEGLGESHKGRGLGDCWATRSFTWDGKQFRLTAASTTGMCRLMAPGGAWALPTVVTNVR